MCHAFHQHGNKRERALKMRQNFGEQFTAAIKWRTWKPLKCSVVGNSHKMYYHLLAKKIYMNFTWWKNFDKRHRIKKRKKNLLTILKGNHKGRRRSTCSKLCRSHWTVRTRHIVHCHLKNGKLYEILTADHYGNGTMYSHEMFHPIKILT